MTRPTARVEELDDDFHADPHAAYRRWSEHGGVHRVRFPDGRTGWVVTGYAEARAALADPRLRKQGANARWLGVQRGMTPAHTHMLDSDPPDHTRLRGLVDKAFTARAVEALRPRVEEVTAGLLDAMDPRAETDLIAEFAVPLPLTVIGELLGVAPAARAEFRRRTGAMFGGTDRDAVAGVMDLLADLVRAKRARPADDLLSALVQARDAGDRLSERELVATAFLLLFAGHETTVNLIGNGVLALLRDPGQLAALRADPSLVPGAVEEFLRHDGPVGFATLRYTAEPVRLGEVEIPAGEFVHVAVNAANRDPSRYPDPDTLDITRNAAGHLAFGHGIHYCVGARLARLEAEIAFTRLLERFPAPRLADPERPLRWHEGVRIHGLLSLPVRLQEDTE